MKKESFRKISAIALVAIMVATAMVVSSCSPSETTSGAATKAPHNDKVNSGASIESNNGDASDIGEPEGAMTEAEEEIDLDSMIFSDDEIANGYAISGDTLIILSDIAVKDKAWSEQKLNIKRIIIKEGVTNIEDRAFMHYTNLIEITIPKSVMTIGESACYGCSNLKEIKVEKGNDNYESVEGVLFTKSKTELIQYPSEKEGAIYTVPDSVDIICKHAFSDCVNLTNVTIPNGVIKIGQGAFSGCSNLTKITIPNSVTSIDKFAFDRCKNLLEITIPDSVTDIGGYAFGGCKKITEITIPDGVTNIGPYMFQNCYALTKVTIPKSVKNIEYEAFVECTNLQTIKFGGSEEEWNEIEKSGSWDDRTGEYTVEFSA